jgi:hypothetical protein
LHLLHLHLNLDVVMRLLHGVHLLLVQGLHLHLSGKLLLRARLPVRLNLQHQQSLLLRQLLARPTGHRRADRRGGRRMQRRSRQAAHAQVHRVVGLGGCQLGMGQRGRPPRRGSGRGVHFHGRKLGDSPKPQPIRLVTGWGVRRGPWVRGFWKHRHVHGHVHGHVPGHVPG